MVLVSTDVLMYLRLGYHEKHNRRIWLSIAPPSKIIEISQAAIRLVLLTSRSLRASPHALVAIFFQSLPGQDARSTPASPPQPASATPATMFGSWRKGAGKGGKQNGGGPYGGPYAPRYNGPQQRNWGYDRGGGGGGQGFTGMLGQMTSVMDNIAALGELTRVGAALSQVQQPVQAGAGPPQAAPAAPAPGVAPPPASPSTPGVSEPARDLARALTDVLSCRRTPPRGTPGSSRRSTACTASRARGLLRLGDPLHTSPRPLRQPAPPGAPGGAPAGEATAAGDPVPLFGTKVNAATHCSALDMLAVGASRANMTQLSQEIMSAEEAALPFSEWWAQVSRCKDVPQWSTRLQALGMPQSEVPTIRSFNQVGQKIYARLMQDGSWADSDQQYIIFP